MILNIFDVCAPVGVQICRNHSSSFRLIWSSIFPRIMILTCLLRWRDEYIIYNDSLYFWGMYTGRFCRWKRPLFFLFCRKTVLVYWSLFTYVEWDRNWCNLKNFSTSECKHVFFEKKKSVVQTTSSGLLVSFKKDIQRGIVLHVCAYWALLTYVLVSFLKETSNQTCSIPHCLLVHVCGYSSLFTYVEWDSDGCYFHVTWLVHVTWLIPVQVWLLVSFRKETSTYVKRAQ